MMSSESLGDLPSWLIPTIGAVSGTGLTGLFLFRRFSKTVLDVNKDRQETNVIRVTIEESAMLRQENQSLRAEMGALARERNDAVAAMGKLSATVQFMGETIAELRLEQRQAAAEVKHDLGVRADTLMHENEERTEVLKDGQKQLSSAIAENTEISKQAVERADAAFKEANTVNVKIEQVGLRVADGSKLSPNEPDARRK